MVNTISVVIPCYNEGEEILKTVENSRKILGKKTEIIVSDQSKDKKIYNALKKNIKEKKIIYTKSPGISRAQTMNHGASLATKDIIVFQHADTFLPSSALSILQKVDLAKYSFGGFYKRFTNTTPLLSWKMWWSNIVIKRMLRGDNIQFIDRRVFYKLGGYKDIRLFEDHEMLKSIKKWNKKHNKDIYIIKDHVFTSPRAFKKAGTIKRNILHTYIKIAYLLGASDKHLQEVYYGKKF